MAEWQRQRKRLIQSLNGDELKADEKLTRMREDEVKRLLFDPYLNGLVARSLGVRKITDYYHV
jgi:hypothetical protein